MATKMLLSLHSHPLCSLPFHSFTQHPPIQKKLVLHVSLHDPLSISSSSSALVDYIAHQHQQQNSYPLVLLAESVGYSLASYYTSLGLFVISVPGLWSLIKRSVKSKIVQKTFIGDGEKKAPNQVAGEILSFFTRNNFAVAERGETITSQYIKFGFHFGTQVPQQ